MRALFVEVEAIRKSDRKRAIALYGEVIAIDPHNEPAYGNRGTLRNAEGDFAGAIQDYTAAIKNSPEEEHGFRNQTGYLYSGRGYAYMKTGDARRAIQDLNRALEMGETQSGALHDRARANLRP